MFLHLTSSDLIYIKLCHFLNQLPAGFLKKMTQNSEGEAARWRDYTIVENSNSRHMLPRQPDHNGVHSHLNYSLNFMVALLLHFYLSCWSVELNHICSGFMLSPNHRHAPEELIY